MDFGADGLSNKPVLDMACYFFTAIGAIFFIPPSMLKIETRWGLAVTSPPPLLNSSNHLHLFVMYLGADGLSNEPLLSMAKH